VPGWRNWQTQRTQNPPTFGSWGFDSPSRHQLNHAASIAYRLSLVFGAPSPSGQPFGCAQICAHLILRCENTLNCIRLRMHMALRYGNAAMARDTRQHKYVAPGLFAQPRKGRMPQDVGDKIRDLTNFQRLFRRTDSRWPQYHRQYFLWCFVSIAKGVLQSGRTTP
jgi:hypothetical protein